MKKYVQILGLWILSITAITIAGCIGVPRSLEPVEGFVADRYLGKWYEIARLNHRFEKDLEAVTAEYSLLPEGKIRVINRGYSKEKGRWKQITGHAKSVSDVSIGHLKVSFFGPFYASYVIFGLDHRNYQYAFVSGYNTNYLWLLSREPKVSDFVRGEFIEAARMAGFSVKDLIWVDQNLNL